MDESWLRLRKSVDGDFNDPNSIMTFRVVNALDKLVQVAEAAREAAVHGVCTDTCGVCGYHFADCEKDVASYADGPPFKQEDLFFACPGARIRSALKAIGIVDGQSPASGVPSISASDPQRAEGKQPKVKVMAHRRSCSRVSGEVPLSAFVFVETGCCTECGARVSIPRKTK